LQQERIAQGRDPVTGAPLAVPNSSSSAMARFGPSRTARIDQQPAASPVRAGQDQSVLLYPRVNPIDVILEVNSDLGISYYLSLYSLQVKGRLSTSLYTSYSAFVNPFDFFATGGPFGQSYLKSNTSNVSFVGVPAASSSSFAEGRLGIGYPYTTLDSSVPTLKTYVFDLDVFMVPNSSYAFGVDQVNTSIFLSDFVQFVYVNGRNEQPPGAFLSDSNNGQTFEDELTTAPLLFGWVRFALSKGANGTVLYLNGQKLLSIPPMPYSPFTSLYLTRASVRAAVDVPFTGQTIAWSGFRFTANKTITGDTYAPRSILRPL
jgi:hypothetical protein